VEELTSKLVNLTSELESVEIKEEEQEESSTVTYPTVLKTEVQENDITDLKGSRPITPLTDIDYLVLTDFSMGMSATELCAKHKISKASLDKLLRNQKAIELVEEITENVRKKSLATATALEHKGIEVLNLMVQTNIEKGNYDTALKLLFGKLSLTEVTERIAKRGTTEEQGTNIQINNLFNDLSGR
jgi:hypothetical protein